MNYTQAHTHHISTVPAQFSLVEIEREKKNKETRTDRKKRVLSLSLSLKFLTETSHSTFHVFFFPSLFSSFSSSFHRLGLYNFILHIIKMQYLLT